MNTSYNYFAQKPNPVKRKSLKTKPAFKVLVDKDTVINVVCHHFGVSLEELNRRSRKEPYPYMRFVIMTFLREFSLPSLQAIGDVFNVDHTTVMSGLTTLRDRMDTEERVFREVNYLRSQLLPN